MNKTVRVSPGDAIFWTNMNADGEVDYASLHGGCVVHKGEKIAAVLWLRAKDQDLLQSPLSNGKLDINKLINPDLSFLGMSPIYSR